MMHEHPFAQFHFCPKCGSPRFVEHNEKSKQCEDCGFVYYFNPSAATVAVILNERQELLACRRGKEPAKGTLDLPGGFSDCFESSEEGVAREVKEETGLEVTRTEFLFSLPNTYLYSGFLVHTVDCFFRCTVADSSLAHARRGRTVVDSRERIAPGRLRPGIREKRHRKAVGTMALIPSPKGRHSAYGSIYSKKLLYIRCNLSFFSTFAAEIL